MRAPLLWMLRFAAIAVLLGGCGETFVAAGSGAGTAGKGGRGGDEGGTNVGSGGGTTTSTTPTNTWACEPLAQDNCNTCLVESCGDSYCACIGSQDCLDLVTCIKAGGDDPVWSWYEQCWQKHKPSIAIAGNLGACGSTHCLDCGLPSVTPCLACEYKSCPNEINNCLADYNCTGFIACLAGCEGAAEPAVCATDCQTTYAAGVPPFQALATCVDSYCSAPCGG